MQLSKPNPQRDSIDVLQTLRILGLTQFLEHSTIHPPTHNKEWRQISSASDLILTKLLKKEKGKRGQKLAKIPN